MSRNTFEAGSAKESPLAENLLSSKTSKKTKSLDSKERPKAMPKRFPALTALISNWNPSDSSASRRLLANEIRFRLEMENHTCINACIPTLIVDGLYPIELMHYHKVEDIDEFVSRMLWIHQEFKSSIGVLIGVTDQDISDAIEEECKSLLNLEEDCVVLLI
jgi:hypothetical protein